MGTDYIKTYLTKDGFDLLNLLNDDFFKPVKLLYNTATMYPRPSC